MNDNLKIITYYYKCYDGELVPDGFYDAMTSLKSYNQSELEKEVVAEQLSLHEHIIKLCVNKKPIPPITIGVAMDLLSRLKKNVKDFYSITALHYINAGAEGIEHFQALLNAIIQDVKNATLDELNVAHGIILYKGHRKDKQVRGPIGVLALVHFYPKPQTYTSVTCTKTSGTSARPTLSTRALAAAMTWPLAL